MSSARNAWLAFALLAMAGCVHVPPDKEARAVAKPETVRRTPAAAELHGAWRSREVRGTLAEFGHTAIYVFDGAGRYTGALVGDAECTPIAGSYRYRDGTLDLDDGALSFRAAFVGDHLELAASDSYLELEPMGPSRHPSPPAMAVAPSLR